MCCCVDALLDARVYSASDAVCGGSGDTHAILGVIVAKCVHTDNARLPFHFAIFPFAVGGNAISLLRAVSGTCSGPEGCTWGLERPGVWLVALQGSTDKHIQNARHWK